MSGRLPFRVVDVFAERRFEGNPLAVVLPPPSASLSDRQMLAIAREMNHSETTFVTGGDPARSRFRARIFTPEEELPFAGHPVLGTAWVLREERLRRRGSRLVLDLAVGEVPVTFEEGAGRVWMDQPAPSFGEVLDPAVLAGVLGLPPQEIDPRFPVQVVSTGLPYILVPLRTLEGLRRCVVDRPRHDLAVRVFVPFTGIPEGSATGSANGCLAAWLLRHRFLGADRTELDLKAGQGHEVHRPSLLSLRAEERGGAIRVAVGGRVVPVARGELVGGGGYPPPDQVLRRQRLRRPPAGAPGVGAPRGVAGRPGAHPGDIPGPRPPGRGWSGGWRCGGRWSGRG